MKKFFHFAALALVASALMVACKSGGEKTEEATKTNDSAVQDSTVIDSAAMVQDTTVAEEAPVATTKAKATTTKKAENKNQLKAGTDQPTTDAKENANNRMAQRAAKDVQVSKGEPTKDAPAVDAKQNSQNRLKARAN